MLNFRTFAYADSTKRSYLSHYRAYFKFCDIIGAPLAPASTTVLCMYVAYLSKFLLPQSVYQYLNFVGILHKDLGLPNPLLDNWSLKTVLSGIKRVHGVPPKPRLPMTLNILLGLRSLLNLNNSFHASFWAICLTAFFGLFRKVHLLPESAAKFDQTKQFTRYDFSPSVHGFNIHVRWSKTIQFGQRTVIIPIVSRPGSLLCPVAAITQAFALCPGAPVTSPAFCWYNSAKFSVLTYKAFMEFLKQSLLRLGIPAVQYGSHSFRRGGASFALESGVPLDVISIMGDWKSDSLFLYLHMPYSQRLAAQQTLTKHLP